MGTAAETFFNALKQGSEALETNEDQSTKEKMKLPEVANTEDGLDAPWSGTSQNASAQHGSAAVEADANERSELLSGLFDTKATSDAATRREMATAFSSVAKGDYTTSSMQFRPRREETKTAAPRSLTLMEQTLRVTGRT
jgi:hypothetical protein